MIEAPNHDIDPKNKDSKWILQNVKYGWQNAKMYTPQEKFWFGRENSIERRRYAMGQNSIDKYKKWLLGEDANDQSGYNISWAVRPKMVEYREKTIAKLMQRKFNIVASIVDPLAASEAEEFYNKMKVKLVARQAMQQVDPSLLEDPALRVQPGEPKSEEELEMFMAYGYKHRMAMEAEMAVDLVLNQGGISKERKKVIEYIVDDGFAGYKEWIDEKGKVQFRAVPENRMVISYANEPDFSDAWYRGEMIEPQISDIAKYFTKEELEEIKNHWARESGNYDSFTLTDKRRMDRLRGWVWDVEFMSFNENLWEENRDENGNILLSKTSFNRDVIAATQSGAEIKRSIRKVFYKAKWIVGTDYMYDFGLATNMKRTKSNWQDTTSSFHLYAFNFHEMRFSGITERLIDLQDEYQMTIYKIQNFKNKWIPYIIDIDLDGLESVALAGKSGKNMEPLELLDFMFQNHIALGRRRDVQNNPNYKSVDVVPTQMANEFSVLFNDLQRIEGEMQRIAGFNDITAGANFGERTLTSGYSAAQQGTMDSLYLLMDAEKKLLEKLATGILQRVQIAIKLGRVEGYAQALGQDTVKFFSISPDLSLYDIGIFLEDQPTDSEIQMLLERMNMKDAQGLLLPEDIIQIKSCRNLKQAEVLLAHKINKRIQEQHQRSLELQKANGEEQRQSAMMAEKAKQETLLMQHQLEMERLAFERETKLLELQIKEQGNTERAAMKSATL